MFNLYRFRLPFKTPFQTAAGTFSYRHGVILRYQKNEIDFVSEASPLPGFSAEGVDDVIQNLTSRGKMIDAFFSGDFNKEELSRFTHSFPNLPSLQFGVSSLGLQLLSRRNNLSFSKLFNTDPPPRQILKNAVIGDVDSKLFMQQATRYIESGFTVIKCKVTANTGHLPESLKNLTKTHPTIAFRLDANQSWSVSQVHALSTQFEGLPIQYIEEPAQSSSIREFNDTASECMLPVAADESIVRFGLQPWTTSNTELPFLVIKPMLLGNLIDIYETIGRSGLHRDKVIFTSTLESAVGRNLTAVSAGLIGSKNKAHGLHTGHLFTDDLIPEDPTVQNPSKMAIRDRGGLSFHEIDRKLLHQVH